jgi:hypothetical protein
VVQNPTRTESGVGEGDMRVRGIINQVTRWSLALGMERTYNSLVGAVVIEGFRGTRPRPGTRS